MKEFVQVTVKEKYEQLKSDCVYYNTKMRGTFINSPTHLEYRELRDAIKKRLKKFEEEYPEVLV